MTEEPKKKKKSPKTKNPHKQHNTKTPTNQQTTTTKLRAWELSLWGSDRCEMHSGSAFE